MAYRIAPFLVAASDLQIKSINLLHTFSNAFLYRFVAHESTASDEGSVCDS